MKKLAYVMLGILLMASCGKQSIPTEYSEENRTARIFPDYKGVVVPPNISPLNFMVQENADNYAVRLSEGNNSIEVYTDKYGKADIPEKEWHEMLAKSKGKDINIEVYAQKEEQWKRYKDFKIPLRLILLTIMLVIV